MKVEHLLSLNEYSDDTDHRYYEKEILINSKKEFKKMAYAYIKENRPIHHEIGNLVPLKLLIYN